MTTRREVIALYGRRDAAAPRRSDYWAAGGTTGRCSGWTVAPTAFASLALFSFAAAVGVHLGLGRGDAGLRLRHDGALRRGDADRT